MQVGYTTINIECTASTKCFQTQSWSEMRTTRQNLVKCSPTLTDVPETKACVKLCLWSDPVTDHYQQNRRRIQE